MIKLINLTPHAVRIFTADGKTELVTVQPSGVVARVAVSRQESGVVPIEADAERLLARDPLAGIPVFVCAYGAVENLPATENGKIFIVSAMVRTAVPTRRDTLSPGELIRDDKGQPIGCCGLEANS